MRENRESFHLQQTEQSQNDSQEEMLIQSHANVRVRKRIQDIARCMLVVSSLFIVINAIIEQTTYPVGNIYGIDLAYLTVPLFISSVFFAVYAHSYRFVKISWKNRKIKLLSVFAGIAYAVFYIFTTNMISTPDIPMPPGLQGFILPLQVLSQMTMWPDVEFWSPQLNLVGYFSVGNVLVVSSLALLTTFSVALLAHNLNRKLGRQGSSSFAGSFGVSLSTNACCCCTPVVLPAVAAFFGIASSNPFVEEIAFQTAPIFNLLWIGTIGLLFASVLLSSRKFDDCSPPAV